MKQAHQTRIIAGALLLVPVASAKILPKPEGRTVISMNDTWQIAESVSENDIPVAFEHVVVVPGLVNQATPSFPEVDLFASHFYFERFARKDRVYLLNATAHPEGTRHKETTVSRRKIAVGK